MKAVSSRLRVGGPSTAAAAWIPEFLDYTSRNNVPVDFVSSHGYDDEPTLRLIGKDLDATLPEEDHTCAAVQHVREQIDASATPKLPLLWTEWNVPGANELRDTPYVGPALAEAIRTCDGHVDQLSFWTFSDVFEEGGPAQRPFIGQFGLRAMYGINKPSFYDFALLHKLGNERLASPAENVLATKLQDGSLALALWNPVKNEKSGPATSVMLELTGVAKNAPVTVERVDEDHGNALKSYKAMGSPQYPKPAQIERMNRESALPPPERSTLHDGKLALQLGEYALVLVHVGSSAK